MRYSGVLATVLATLTSVAMAAQPLVDAHVHYKWTQEEVTSPEQAISSLEKAGVELAVVIGTPAEKALRLHELAPQRIVPIFGPYRPGSQDWHAWQFRRELIEEARQALASGRYHGIGELHLIGGFAARWERSPVLKAFLALSKEFRVPLLLHVEFAAAKPMLSLCGRHPEATLVLAHAGAPMPAGAVGEILRRCPNVWMELAARDHWRYVRNPIVGDEGRLLPEWEKLVLEYPERFIVGSDTVWPVDRMGGWDEPDTGWERIGEFLDFHRRWLSFLPSEVADRVGRLNALALYRGGG